MSSDEKLARIVKLCGDRLKTAGDILEYADFFFIPDDEIRYLKELTPAQIEIRRAGGIVEREHEPIGDEDARLLCFWRDVVGPSWTPEALEGETKGVAEYEGVKLGHLVKLIRFAISGKHKGPGLYESLVELGRTAVHCRVGNRIGYPWSPTIKQFVIWSRRIWMESQTPKLEYHRSPIASPKDAYFQSVLDRGYGMMTCGDYLGVMVAPEGAILGCPKGWCFIPSEIATMEILKLAWAHMTEAKGRREKWPKNQKVTKKTTTDEMLEIVFDSQDYIE